MTLNCPFPAGSGRNEILGAFREKFAPRMDAFRPDLVMISAGFDSRIGDPLGRFVLTDTDFSDLTAVMLELADKHRCPAQRSKRRLPHEPPAGGRLHHPHLMPARRRQAHKLKRLIGGDAAADAEQNAGHDSVYGRGRVSHKP